MRHRRDQSDVFAAQRAADSALYHGTTSVSVFICVHLWLTPGHSTGFSQSAESAGSETAMDCG